MSDQNPNKPTIEYRAGRDDLPQRMARPIVLGAILSAVAVVGLVFTWIVANFQLGPPGSAPEPFHWVVPSIMTIGAVGILAPLGWWSYRRYRWRGLALGLLI